MLKYTAWEEAAFPTFKHYDVTHNIFISKHLHFQNDRNHAFLMKVLGESQRKAKQ